MELLPLGPVLFIDTAGMDDVGDLGELRVARTRRIFDRTDLGVLVGEAGADRYLLRFETSDRELYDLIHPPLAGRRSDRLAGLRALRRLGYEIGGGVMIGIPGQTYAGLAADIVLFREMDLDMIGVGPYIENADSPLGRAEDQVPNTELMAYKVVALTRIVCPEANIPSTTALAAINQENARELGLCRGANVVMPNLTPPQYRALYAIYPQKACVTETAESCRRCLAETLHSLGRVIGQGRGDRRPRTRGDGGGDLP